MTRSAGEIVQQLNSVLGSYTERPTGFTNSYNLGDEAHATISAPLSPSQLAFAKTYLAKHPESPLGIQDGSLVITNLAAAQNMPQAEFNTSVLQVASNIAFERDPQSHARVASVDHSVHTAGAAIAQKMTAPIQVADAVGMATGISGPAQGKARDGIA